MNERGKKMTNDLTLIETEVLEELLEKAILYDLIEDEYILKQENPDINHKVLIKKHNFLSKYINVDVNFDVTIVDALEKKGYK